MASVVFPLRTREARDRSKVFMASAAPAWMVLCNWWLRPSRIWQATAATQNRYQNHRQSLNPRRYPCPRRRPRRCSRPYRIVRLGIRRYRLIAAGEECRGQ
ncbi:MAG: hypothetical protein GY854_25985 [Deltaproteobacteria bacterium]|nr:hypothetical protein [Deltaproteobacteria bacterium]